MEVGNDDGGGKDSIQTVEIIKQPGQTLGFYIREGNGLDRSTGVFISRIAPGSVIAGNGLLRVNDEILSVNAVDVTRMSLDDVVILMSIAKCLVLAVRIPAQSHRLDAAAIYAGAPEADDGQGRDQGQGRQPVVVLKSGFANSFSRIGMERLLDVDAVQNDALGGRSGVGRYPSLSPLSSSPQMTYVVNRGQRGSALNDDLTGDLFLVSRMTHDLQRSGINVVARGPSSVGYGGEEPPGGYRYDLQQPQPHPVEMSNSRNQKQQSNMTFYTSPASRSPRQLDYASDTDIVYHHQTQSPFDQIMSRCNIYRGKGSGDYGTVGTRPRNGHPDGGSVSPYNLNGSLTPDQYSSDSEVISNYQRSPRVVGVGTLRTTSQQTTRHRNEGRNQNGGRWTDGNHVFLSLPNRSREDDLNQLAQIRSVQLNNLQRSPLTQSKNPGSYISGRNGTSGCRIPSNSLLSSSLSSAEYATLFNRRGSPMRSWQGQGQGQGQGRLTRKMSTDSLLDGRTTYRPEEAGIGGRSNEAFNLRDVPVAENLNSSYLPMSTMTLMRSSHQQQQQLGSFGRLPGDSTMAPSSSSKSRNFQMTRMPLKIQTETFRSCPADRGDYDADAGVGLSGLLHVHVFCGHGLKSSRTALRDLYCVVEVDAVNKARTMIRTGAINFDWDEEFEVDLADARRLAFLVYSWDPNTRHALCFSGILILPALLLQLQLQQAAAANPKHRHHRQRLAVKLEPKGTLYVEVRYVESAVVLLRRPSPRWNAVFGADLKSIVHREKSGFGVPLLLLRCVDEVERRGLDYAGLYCLCGSARRKQQLKEELEQDVRSTDLSVDAVTDINVITSVIKDFLRELPEPLCSNALYQMLLDALSVQVPGDHEGNSQLMLNILECLPRINQETLVFLLNHLKRVALKSNVNKMTTVSLAICLGPALICPSTENDHAGGGEGHLLQHATSLNLGRQVELLRYLLDIWQENQRVTEKPNNECSAMMDASFRSSSTLRSKSSSIVTGQPPDAAVDGCVSERKPSDNREALEEVLAWKNAETSPC